MRINEFANAESILALWKLISDTTWMAVQQQAELQAKQRAERDVIAKSRSVKKPKRSSSRAVPKSIALPKPKPTASSAVSATKAHVPKPKYPSVAQVPQPRQAQPKTQVIKPKSTAQANTLKPPYTSTTPTQLPQAQPNQLSAQQQVFWHNKALGRVTQDVAKQAVQ